MAAVPWVPLTAMSTDIVCDRVKQIDGLDTSMLEQYTTTIKKANVNGRVLSQCNLEELKKEMNMNFGDWQLFRAMVVEQRQAESQPLRDDSRAGSELGSSVGGPAETSRRPGGPADAAAAALPSDSTMRYSLNLSFEELSNLGLEEPPQRHNNNNSHWTTAPNHRTPSMTSLNSQESSNDICKLTDKQQAEYHTAYQEYIAQMAQLEGLGAGMERPVPYPIPGGAEEKTKEGEPDGRKPFPKGRSKVTDASDGDAQLDPITEEDEKPDAGSAARGLLSRKSKGPGPRYHKVPSDEDESGAEESDSTPLLSEERKRRQAEEAEAAVPPESAHLLSKGKDYLSDILLDKKESSDSGLRSSGSSSDHSLQDADSEPEKAEPEAPREPEAAERSDLIELLEPEGLVRKRVGGLPRNLSGLQDAAVMRMSICSEAPSEGSAMASSPEENWPVSAVTNLNRSASNSTLNNNNSANTQHALRETNTFGNTNTIAVDSDSPPIIISPGSTNTTTSITTTAVLHNDNLRALQRKRGPSAVSQAEEERESVL